MSRRFHRRFPVRLKSWTNERLHWTAAHKRKQMERQLLAIGVPLGALPSTPALVTFTRYSPRMMDDDNLPSCFKVLRDELAKMYRLDDGPRSPLSWRYEQVQTKRGDPDAHGFAITIESAEKEW